jgi:hypothetical protein
MVLQNYCEAMMLRWKPTKNAGSRSDKLCVNRICDTLLVKPADCGSRCRPLFQHLRVSPRRVRAATFSSTSALPDRLSLRFSIPCCVLRSS